MKRLFSLLAIVVFTLCACANNDPKLNTISVAEVTEREKAILSTTSETSFVFDFNMEEEYKEISVWIEKYESGKLVGDKISFITTQVEGNGSIIFATSKTDDTRKIHTFNIGIASKGSTGSISGFDENSDGLDRMASVIGNFTQANNSIEGEVILANICYSIDANGMSNLSTDFYNDANSHMEELEGYDVVYLLKMEVKK